MASSEQKPLASTKVESKLIEEVDESGFVIAEYAVLPDGIKAVHHERSRSSMSIGERLLEFWRYLLGVFLPAGYPHSVTEDYIDYQIYDSLQAFCSSIAGLLSSRAVLSSVGVGDSTASPTTALLLSVLQESVGRVATILFAHRLGTSLEPECKAYRLLADVFNDAAMLLDCLSPAFPRHLRVPILSSSSALRALCGVAAGSAKASLSAHFAKKGNLGEVNAKDSSQETVISLIGMLTGTVVVSRVTSTWATWTAMVFLLGLHLLMNWLAVCSVNMNTLNRQRANIVFSYLADASGKASSAPTPKQVAEIEATFAMDGTLTEYSNIRHGNCRSRRVGYVELSTSLAALAFQVERDSVSLSSLVEGFGKEKFILWRSRRTKRTYVSIKEGATAEDILKAWTLALRWNAIIDGSGPKATEPATLWNALQNLNLVWDSYMADLEEGGWDISIGSIETGKARRLKFRTET